MVEARRHGDTPDGAARWPAVTATRFPVVRTHFVDRAGIDREPRVLLGVVVLHDLTGHGLRRMEIEEAAVRAEGTVDDARDEVRADDAEPDRARDPASGECPRGGGHGRARGRAPATGGRSPRAAPRSRSSPRRPGAPGRRR